MRLASWFVHSGGWFHVPDWFWAADAATTLCGALVGVAVAALVVRFRSRRGL
jgi:hypothetical protein